MSGLSHGPHMSSLRHGPHRALCTPHRHLMRQTATLTKEETEAQGKVALSDLTLQGKSTAQPPQSRRHHYLQQENFPTVTSCTPSPVHLPTMLPLVNSTESPYKGLGTNPLALTDTTILKSLQAFRPRRHRPGLGDHLCGSQVIDAWGDTKVSGRIRSQESES